MSRCLYHTNMCYLTCMNASSHTLLGRTPERAKLHTKLESSLIFNPDSTCL